MKNRAVFTLVVAAFIIYSDFLLDSPMPWVGSAQGQVAGARPSYSVASGDVTPTTAVIWARAIGRQRAVMSVEVSTDANFAPGATRPGGTAWIDANTDYTGKILLSGLTPRTVYHYRVWFGSGKTSARTGTFITAPLPDELADVSFAWVSDLGGQGACRTLDESFNGYPILNAVAKTDMHFFVFLGDQIYADNACPKVSPVRNLKQLPGPPPTARGMWTYEQNLRNLRLSWAYNRAEPKFQNLLARASMYAMWDDHEIINDWGGKELSGRDPSPLVAPDPGLLAAGLRAFLEWNPIATLPSDPYRAYRKFRWGQSAEFFMLDNRSYRDRNDMPDGPGKTMLGAVQMAWLKEALAETTARWKVIFTSVPLSIPTGFPVQNGRDGWGAPPDPAVPGIERTGFESELGKILRFIKDRGIRNVIWLTTDVHFAEFIRYRPDLDRDGRPDLDFYEVANGPLSAITAALPPAASHSQTFRPEVVFQFGGNAFGFVPELFNFGLVRITGRTGELTVEIRDLNGIVKGSLIVLAQ